MENIGFLLATILVEANNFLWMIKKVIVPAKQMPKALPDINYIWNIYHVFIGTSWMRFTSVSFVLSKLLFNCRVTGFAEYVLLFKNSILRKFCKVPLCNELFCYLLHQIIILSLWHCHWTKDCDVTRISSFS